MGKFFEELCDDKIQALNYDQNNGKGRKKAFPLPPGS